MTVAAFLIDAAGKLKTTGIETARLDALVLLEDELGTNRAALLAHPERVVKSSALPRLRRKLNRRAAHEPLAYIRGKAAFYGREFFVNEHVLVPRPESEKIIEQLKSVQFSISPEFVPLYIADVGAGSGCLGITAALELPGAFVDFYDSSSKALVVAIKNAERYALSNLSFTVGDLLADPRERLVRGYDVVLANLPYVPSEYQVNPAAQHEPKIALFGGDDGLDVYRTFWRQIAKLEHKPKFIITESFPFQHKKITALAKTAAYRLEVTDDFAQRFAAM